MYICKRKHACSMTLNNSFAIIIFLSTSNSKQALSNLAWMCSLYVGAIHHGTITVHGMCHKVMLIQ